MRFSRERVGKMMSPRPPLGYQQGAAAWHAQTQSQWQNSGYSAPQVGTVTQASHQLSQQWTSPQGQQMAMYQPQHPYPYPQQQQQLNVPMPWQPWTGPWQQPFAPCALNMQPPNAVDSDSDDEGRDACSNVAGLLLYLDTLLQNQVYIVEVTHVVCKWVINDVTLPLKHHGLILKQSDHKFLRAHFVREGIAWKAYESCPSYPDSVCYVKAYPVSAKPDAFRHHCEETKKWSWPNNDCEKWSHAALRSLGVSEKLYSSSLVPHPDLPGKQALNKMWRRQKDAEAASKPRVPPSNKLFAPQVQ